MPHVLSSSRQLRGVLPLNWPDCRIFAVADAWNRHAWLAVVSLRLLALAASNWGQAACRQYCPLQGLTPASGIVVEPAEPTSRAFKKQKARKIISFVGFLLSCDCARLAAHEFAWASVKPHIPNAPTATQLVCACHPHILRYFINPAC